MRGAVLFEVMLAVVLFGGAAAFTLAAVRSVFTALESMRLQQEAVDLAKSKMAQLEAGLITLADLRGDAGATTTDASADAPKTGHEWNFELKTQRTPYTSLTLVELTVRQSGVDAEKPNDAAPMSYTLRQLIKTREPGGSGDE